MVQSPRVTSLNGKMLVWAREQAGISTAQLAAALKKDEPTILSWERGTDAPTLRQLEDVAAYFKKPLAIFFFSDPPELPSIKKKFRMLPGALDPEEARDTLFALQEAQARQLSILELTGGENVAGPSFLFRTWKTCNAAELRKILGITIEEQMAFRSEEEAYKAWRERFERVGILVFNRSFKQRAISGFCLPHVTAPTITVNNGTTWTRQIFTLFHEICHLAHDHHGVTRADSDYTRELSEGEQRVEAECNRFAASFLLPPEHTSTIIRAFAGRERDIDALASRYKVSREVVLRRLLDRGVVTREIYDTWTRKWARDFFARRRPSKPGGNYYATMAHYLGRGYLHLAFSSYVRGKCTAAELAEHLGIKARNLTRLEPFLEAFD